VRVSQLTKVEKALRNSFRGAFSLPFIFCLINVERLSSGIISFRIVLSKLFIERV